GGLVCACRRARAIRSVATRMVPCAKIACGWASRRCGPWALSQTRMRPALSPQPPDRNPSSADIRHRYFVKECGRAAGLHVPPAARLALKKYRGRRREPGLRVQQRSCAAARCGGAPPPLLHQPQKLRLMKLEPLSRRRPQASTGPATSNAMLTAVRLAPARLTQSSTSFEVED